VIGGRAFDGLQTGQVTGNVLGDGPVVPEDLDPTTNQTLDDLLDGNLGEGGVPAFAFTNPLFLDVGNNGWTAPGVANAPCAE